MAPVPSKPVSDTEEQSKPESQPDSMSHTEEQSKPESQPDNLSDTDERTARIPSTPQPVGTKQRRASSSSSKNKNKKRRKKAKGSSGKKTTKAPSDPEESVPDHFHVFRKDVMGNGNFTFCNELPTDPKEALRSVFYHFVTKGKCKGAASCKCWRMGSTLKDSVKDCGCLRQIFRDLMDKGISKYEDFEEKEPHLHHFFMTLTTAGVKALDAFDDKTSRFWGKRLDEQEKKDPESLLHPALFLSDHCELRFPEAQNKTPHIVGTVPQPDGTNKCFRFCFSAFVELFGMQTQIRPKIYSWFQHTFANCFYEFTYEKDSNRLVCSFSGTKKGQRGTTGYLNQWRLGSVRPDRDSNMEAFLLTLQAMCDGTGVGLGHFVDQNGWHAFAKNKVAPLYESRAIAQVAGKKKKDEAWAKEASKIAAAKAAAKSQGTEYRGPDEPRARLQYMNRINYLLRDLLLGCNKYFPKPDILLADPNHPCFHTHIPPAHQQQQWIEQQALKPPPGKEKLLICGPLLSPKQDKVFHAIAPTKEHLLLPFMYAMLRANFGYLPKPNANLPVALYGNDSFGATQTCQADSILECLRSLLSPMVDDPKVNPNDNSKLLSLRLALANPKFKEMIRWDQASHPLGMSESAGAEFGAFLQRHLMGLVAEQTKWDGTNEYPMKCFGRVVVARDCQLGGNNQAWMAPVPNFLLKKETIAELEKGGDVKCMRVVAPIAGPGFCRILSKVKKGDPIETCSWECIIPPGNILVLDCTTMIQQAIRCGRQGGPILEMLVVVAKDKKSLPPTDQLAGIQTQFQEGTFPEGEDGRRSVVLCKKVFSEVEVMVPEETKATRTKREVHNAGDALITLMSGMEEVVWSKHQESPGYKKPKKEELEQYKAEFKAKITPKDIKKVLDAGPIEHLGRTHNLAGFSDVFYGLPEHERKEMVPTAEDTKKKNCPHHQLVHMIALPFAEETTVPESWMPSEADKYLQGQSAEHTDPGHPKTTLELLSRAILF